MWYAPILQTASTLQQINHMGWDTRDKQAHILGFASLCGCEVSQLPSLKIIYLANPTSSTEIITIHITEKEGLIGGFNTFGAKCFLKVAAPLKIINIFCGKTGVNPPITLVVTVNPLLYWCSV